MSKKDLNEVLSIESWGKRVIPQRDCWKNTIMPGWLPFFWIYFLPPSKPSKAHNKASILQRTSINEGWELWGENGGWPGADKSLK